VSSIADIVVSVGKRLSGLVIAAVVGIHPAQAQDMTAGLILEKMQPEERFAYINGIVEGMAYARFRKDTIATGSKDEAGMKCIYGWYYTGDGKTHARIEAAFRKFSDHMPSVIIGTMVKKECGE
jgi:hypothetical protein